MRVTLTASGEVSDFTPAVRADIETLFAAQAGVPAESVALSVTPASVRLAVEIAAGNASAADGVADALAPIVANASTATSFLSQVPAVSNISITDVSTVAVVDLADAAPPSAPPPMSPVDEGLSDGAIAGIVIGSLVAAALCLGLGLKARANVMASPGHSSLGRRLSAKRANGPEGVAMAGTRVSKYSAADGAGQMA